MATFIYLKSTCSALPIFIHIKKDHLEAASNTYMLTIKRKYFPFLYKALGGAQQIDN